MAVSKEEILNAISNMSVMDVVELIKSMEDKFGVSAAAAVAVAARDAERQKIATAASARSADRSPNIAADTAGPAAPVRRAQPRCCPACGPARPWTNRSA